MSNGLLEPVGNVDWKLIVERESQPKAPMIIDQIMRSLESEPRSRHLWWTDSLGCMNQATEPKTQHVKCSLSARLGKSASVTKPIA